MFATGMDIGPKLIDALQLGRGVTAIDMRVRIKEPVTITIERRLMSEQQPAFVSVLEEYTLQPKRNGNPFSIVNQFDSWLDWTVSMPSSPPVACPCGGRRHAGQPCDRCGKGGKRQARKQHDQQRGSSTERGYDYQWQQFRKRYLAANPLCADCEAEGRVGAAEHIHHKRKLADHPELKYEDGNLMPLCERHHNERTAKGE